VPAVPTFWITTVRLGMASMIAPNGLAGSRRI
jgi:hypothetical protein